MRSLSCRCVRPFYSLSMTRFDRDPPRSKFRYSDGCGISGLARYVGVSHDSVGKFPPGFRMVLFGSLVGRPGNRSRYHEQLPVAANSDRRSSFNQERQQCLRNLIRGFVKSYGMCVCDIHLSPLVYSYRAGQVQNITSPGSPDSGAPEAFPTPAVVGVIGADSCKIIEISHGGNTVGVDQIHEPL